MGSKTCLSAWSVTPCKSMIYEGFFSAPNLPNLFNDVLYCVDN